MLLLLARRLASMVLIMAVVSFVLFLIFEGNKLAVAGKVLGPYSSQEQRELWLEQNGYNRPFLVRYAEWVGDAGASIQRQYISRACVAKRPICMSRPL